MIRRAIIPAAGLGTRLRPLTLGVAKELLPLGRHPAFAATLLEAKAADIRELCIISSAKKPGLERFFATYDLVRDFDVRLVPQPTPAGVLDAVARGLVSVSAKTSDASAIAVLFPDLIHLPDQTALGRLVAAHERCNAAVFGLRIAQPKSLLGPSAAVQLDEKLDDAQIEEARQSGRPLRIRRVGPSRGTPGEILTTFGQIHTPDLGVAIDAHCRQGGTSSHLDDAHFLTALDALAKRGGLYGVLLPGEVIDVGTMDGYLDASARFLSGAVQLRGLS